jgi:hypothetical protein
MIIAVYMAEMSDRQGYCQPELTTLPSCIPPELRYPDFAQDAVSTRGKGQFSASPPYHEHKKETTGRWGRSVFRKVVLPVIRATFRGPEEEWPDFRG